MIEDSVSKNEEIIQRIRNHIQSKHMGTKDLAGQQVFKRQDNIRRHTAGVTMTSDRSLKHLQNWENKAQPSSDAKPTEAPTKVQSPCERLKENQNIQKQNSRVESLGVMPSVTGLSFLCNSIQKDQFKNRFHIIKALGKGKCADVFLASDKLTNQLVALKLIQKSLIVNENLMQLMIREIKIQRVVKHPNIIKLFGVLSDEKKVCLVMEYCEHNLYTYREAMTFDHYLSILYQVTSALAYMHQNNIIHRDLKLENVLMIHNQAKIADLGLALYAKGLSDERVEILEYCGTKGYMAPEVCARKGYGLKADAYSLGVFAYELYNGVLPDEARGQLFDHSMPKQLQDCIGKLLHPNPDLRMSVKDALGHQLFKPMLNSVLLNLPLLNNVFQKSTQLLNNY